MCKTHGDHAQSHRLLEIGAADGPTLGGESPKGNTETQRYQWIDTAAQKFQW